MVISCSFHSIIYLFNCCIDVKLLLTVVQFSSKQVDVGGKPAEVQMTVRGPFCQLKSIVHDCIVDWFYKP